jgi:CubicO group peptidase (beta-lactamase class C family)
MTQQQKPNSGPMAILESGARQTVTPGAVFGLTRGEGEKLVTQDGAVGTLDARGKRPVTLASIYDLASLTKILAGALLVAEAIDQNKLVLDETPWPKWEGVKVQHMLMHTSGLPAWKPLFEAAGGQHPSKRTRAAVLEAALKVGLQSEPGRLLVYSDVGFIALTALIEQRLNARVDEIFDSVAKRVWGSHSIAYVPLDKIPHHPELDDVAVGGWCEHRKHHVWGVVHDMNCYAMAGVSLHAGLFGAACDVSQAAYRYMCAVTQPREPFDLILKHFALHGGPRGLVFDRVSMGGTTGTALSLASFGHLGFTGTSLWIDPDAKRTYVLLANRLVYGNDRNAMRLLRARFHEAAAKI